MGRILRVIARLNVGGPAIHVSLVSAGLAAKGWETRLLAGEVADGEGDMEWFAKEHGVAVEKVPGLGREIRAGGDLRALAHLRRVIREWKPDVVHTHTAKAGTLGRLAAIAAAGGRARAKRVHTFHGHVLSGYFGAAKQAAFRSIERALARRTDRLVVPAPRLADELAGMRVGRREQYRVVPLGFELERFLAVPERRAAGPLRKELGVPDDAVLAGFVGRLTAIKAPAALLAALAKLARRTRRAVWVVFVGDGELRGPLEAEAAKLGVADRVRFAGWRKDTAAVYAELDLVALTSLNEGTPVALIEAMASARAVVATAVGGVPDVVEDGVTGLLVAPGREDLFAVALGRLADEEALRAKLAAAGRERAAGRFRVERLVADLDGVYREIVT